MASGLIMQAMARITMAVPIIMILPVQTRILVVIMMETVSLLQTLQQTFRKIKISLPAPAAIRKDLPVTERLTPVTAAILT